MNVGGLEEVQSNDPAVMKSTSLGSLDGDSEHSQDLHVKVEDPEKHIEGYVSYYVLTKVSQSTISLGWKKCNITLQKKSILAIVLLSVHFCSSVIENLEF